VRGFLLVNPRAGGAQAAEELCAEAVRLGIEAHVVRPGEEAAELTRTAVADTIGIAGGDGSLAPVAAVAVECDLPFVCVPAGRTQPPRATWVSTGTIPSAPWTPLPGVERRVDVGRVNGRLLVNHVSLGSYAALVDEVQRAGRLRALMRATRRWKLRFEIDGDPVRAGIVVVGNNAYRLEPIAVGVRDRLDEGILHLGIARGWLPRTWTDRRGSAIGSLPLRGGSEPRSTASR
jgi:Diacylglycerol kinase catalytic domain